MKLTKEENYADAMKAHGSQILLELREHPPKKVAKTLETNGWPREWACFAVRDLEQKHNPGNLTWGAEENQNSREKYQAMKNVGGAILFIGLLVTLFTTFSAMATGGLMVVAYGAIISGGVSFWTGMKNLKRFPNRDLPRYIPPRKRGGVQDADSF